MMRAAGLDWLLEGRSGWRKGFTLTEIVVALFLLSITLLAIGPLISGVTGGTKYGQFAASAAGRLQEKIEQLKNVPYASVVNGSENLTNPSMTRTVAVVAEPVAGKLKEVNVTVTWTERGASRHLGVKTFIANRNP
jgi:prepilin-type N-terminal cleavage/methylation domain-containing protein